MTTTTPTVATVAPQDPRIAHWHVRRNTESVAIVWDVTLGLELLNSGGALYDANTWCVSIDACDGTCTSDGDPIEPDLSFCTFNACSNAYHVHDELEDENGIALTTPIGMTCIECGVPTHYDYAVESYRHDDPNHECARIEWSSSCRTTITLPPMFYDDHAARDLPSGNLVRRTKRSVVVELTDDEAADLLSDAAHYASPGMYPDPEYFGLVSSARATVHAITKAVAR